MEEKIFKPKWSTIDSLYLGLYKDTTYLHLKKLSYVKYYKDVVIDAADKYNLPPILIAGVMYIEYGGDPMWFDDAAYNIRALDVSAPDWLDKKLGLSKKPELTSYGNTSIQIRRAIEMLGYDDDKKHHKKIIESLKDPIQSIYMTACHLNELRNIDFADKSADELTEEDIKIIASRYNIGPEPEKNAILTEYGQKIYNNKDDILRALNQKESEKNG